MSIILLTTICSHSFKKKSYFFSSENTFKSTSSLLYKNHVKHLKFHYTFFIYKKKKVASTVRLHHYCNMSADCQTTY